MPEFGSPERPSSVQIPQLNRDLAASLACWPIEFRLGGSSFTIPARPAQDWLVSLMSDEQVMVLDLFLDLIDPDDEGAFVEAFLHSEEDLERVYYKILESASGRFWWVTLRLIGMAQGSWQYVGAKLLLEGVRADQLSLSAWLDVFTYQLAKMMDPEKATMYFSQLEMPPPNEALPEEEFEMSAEQFLSLGS